MAYASWEEFRESHLGSAYMLWHEGGPSEDAITRLSSEQRAETIPLIAEGIRSGDYVAIMCAKDFEPKRFLSVLREAVPTFSDGRAVIEASLMLAEHGTKEERHVAEERLRNQLHVRSAMLRIYAAVTLRSVVSSETDTALLQAIEQDPEPLVRYHAIESMLVAHQVTPATIDQHPGWIRGISDEHPEDRGRVVQELRAACGIS